MAILNELIEDRIRSEIATALPAIDMEVSTSVENLINSGRKFRANLFYNTSRCFGYASKEDLITISASLELLHRADLMHDDLADESNTRRGIITLHSLYSKPLAVYIPLILKNHAEQMLVKYPLIQKELARAHNEICQGQILETCLSKSTNFTWKDYERVVELKSAGLGRFALGSAYYLAHNQIDEENPRKIAKTGALLFQIVDDLEDLLEIRYPFSIVSIDVQNRIKTAQWFFLSTQEQTQLRHPDEIQTALTRPDILQKTYQRAEEYLAQLSSQFKKWLPDNNYRRRILDMVNERFNERSDTYRSRIR